MPLAWVSNTGQTQLLPQQYLRRWKIGGTRQLSRPPQISTARATNTALGRKNAPNQTNSIAQTQTNYPSTAATHPHPSLSGITMVHERGYYAGGRPPPATASHSKGTKTKRYAGPLPNKTDVRDEAGNATAVARATRNDLRRTAAAAGSSSGNQNLLLGVGVHSPRLSPATSRDRRTNLLLARTRKVCLLACLPACLPACKQFLGSTA